MLIARQRYLSVRTLIIEPSKSKNSAWNGSSRDIFERSIDSHCLASAVNMSPYLVLMGKTAIFCPGMSFLATASMFSLSVRMIRIQNLRIFMTVDFSFGIVMTI